MRFVAAGALGAAASLVGAAGAQAEDISVTTLADSGHGSLRDAIERAETTPARDRILFDSGLSGTIRLDGALPTVTKPLDVEGPGAGDLTVRGDGKDRIFYLSSPYHSHATISGLTLSGGSASEGGAINSYGTHVTLAHSTITGNDASSSGGGIHVSYGALTVRDSKLTGNSSTYPGGAISSYESSLRITGSTLSGNEAGGSGGAIDVTKALGEQSLQGATISGNSSGGDGGGISFSSYGPRSLKATRSKITGNKADGDGGGLAIVEGSDPVLSETTISGNEAGGNGPDIWPKPAPKPKPKPKKQEAKPRPQPSIFGPNGDTAAITSSGIAIPPPSAPTAVQASVSAANLISRSPYVWGGGHGSWYSLGYDCSGAVSFALYGGGFLLAPLDSSSLETWGAPGPGKWITVYANPGHAFAVIAGLRWDTVGDAVGTGPRWHNTPASTAGFVARHPPGY